MRVFSLPSGGMFHLRRDLARSALSPRAHTSTSAVRNPLPATFLRGGTSKGIYINRADLPEDQSQWDRIFLGIMGSPDSEYGRQLNGMGGGVSSLSKICVVGTPSEEHEAQGLDVEYTFVQVGIRDSAIDYSGNCGNLSSMIGVFALDEGLCIPAAVHSDTDVPTATVRSYNTNTKKRIDTTFPIALSEDRTCIPLLDLPQMIMAGVPGKASQITLDFTSPGGARTGHLLPTGNPFDIFDLSNEAGVPVCVRASLVDATNPTVFVTEDDLTKLCSSPLRLADGLTPEVEHTVEMLRQLGATSMALDPTAQAQPKICILRSPARDDPNAADISVTAFSMGVPHKAIPMTVGLCLGVAAGVQNTLPWDIVRQAREARGASSADELVRIRHPGGIVDVGASFGAEGEVLSAKVVRTGRRLMKGVVWW